MRLISLTTATVENNDPFIEKELLMLNRHLLKKALVMSAFFMFLSFSNIYAIENCAPPLNSSAEKAKVKWVYDGDTLLLSDDRKIRIIGIDTPETRHHNQKAQAYGAKSREALRELLKHFNYNVSLHYGKERTDRYSRTLAHVYLPNGQNISSWLLEQGLAKILAIPPNVKLADCYKLAEKHAQQRSLKIWRLKSHKQKSATTLKRRIKGYVRLKGKIKSIKHNKKSVVIELESNIKRPISIKIKNKNMHYFNAINFKKLIDKYIIVSGMLKNKYGKRIIQLNHPSQLEFITTKKVVPTIKWSLQQ